MTSGAVQNHTGMTRFSQGICKLLVSATVTKKIQDSKDFIVHFKHHIKNGNRSSVTQ